MESESESESESINLPNDILLMIIEYLSDDIKLKLILSNNFFYNNKLLIPLNNKYYYSKIKKVFYNFKFINVYYDDYDFVSGDIFYKNKTIKILSLHYSYHYKISDSVLHLVTSDFSIEPVKYPKKLISFRIISFNSKLSKLKLPQSLKELYLSCNYNRTIEENDLPHNLEKLVF